MRSNGNWQGRPAHLDDAHLAAFVDGRLTAREREGVVAHLASCETCYEVFSETVSFQTTELEEEEEPVVPAAGPPAVRRFPPAVRKLWWPTVALAAAAGIVLAVGLVWRLAWRGGELPVAAIASALTGSDAAAATVRRNLDAHGWPQTLGADSLGAAEEIAFRLGVRATEIEVALAAGDRPTAERLSHRVESLLGSIELGPTFASAYYGDADGGLRERLAAGASNDSLLELHHDADAELSAINEEGVGFVDPFWYRLGKWSEAGRLAAGVGDEGHFSSAPHRRFLRRLRDTEISPRIVEPVAEVERLLRQQDPPADELERAFAELVRVAGGGEAG